MNNNLEKIHNYLINEGVKKEDLEKYDADTKLLAQEIMEYAHRNQRRENGEGYSLHPYRCAENYKRLLGRLNPNEKVQIEKGYLHDLRIPYEGVEEVCYLHDVVEDTEFKLKDIEEIYTDCGFKQYFDTFIKEPLKLITHDKAMKYDDYIDLVLTDRTASLVKLFDLQDNLFVLDLIDYDLKSYHRANNYLYYTFLINEKYKFLQRFIQYRVLISDDD